MFSIIFYQNNNAQVPAIGADKEGGIIFGGEAPLQAETIAETDFVPASDSSADAESCD